MGGRGAGARTGCCGASCCGRCGANGAGAIIGNRVYLFQEGIRMRITKIVFDPDRLTPQALRNPTSRTRRDLHTSSSAPLESGQAEPLAPRRRDRLKKGDNTKKRTDAENEEANHRRSRNDAPSPNVTWRVPEPPTRPSLPLSLTMQDRSDALLNYIGTLGELEKEYTKTIEESVERRIAVCNLEIESLQSHAKK